MNDSAVNDSAMNDSEPAAPFGGGGLASSMRLRLDFGYDGTAYSGWASQPRKRTVETELSVALTLILRSDKPVRLTIAGRTDAGVHARGAVAHADIDPAGWTKLSGRTGRTLAQAAIARLNGVLPPDIRVHAVSPAPDGFHARYSAIRRRYLYRICDDPSALDPLRRHDTVVHRHQLDVEAMDAAGRRLLGLSDFAAFCMKREGATTIRTLLEFSWARHEDGTVSGTVVADAFCRSMVRSLVGALIPVGEGRRPVDWPAEVLRDRRRHPAVVVMPPHGLSLEQVFYPPDADLGRRAVEARSKRTVTLHNDRPEVVC